MTHLLHLPGSRSTGIGIGRQDHDVAADSIRVNQCHASSGTLTKAALASKMIAQQATSTTATTWMIGQERSAANGITTA